MGGWEAWCLVKHRDNFTFTLLLYVCGIRRRREIFFEDAHYS